ncbi:arginine--tRNA ligase, cytoplasmic-like [Asparagus officinalis]|nr:arginine--tRNA ligase, cytoplasmic-like [Asparagus officinalis]XP_020249571.1 arginine--tRNA ligase, cytoplasmic-like [Asparagus officinalis]XP_020249572.1 arginine--tRNA ligase, cytoplasmic-like [Asparagus officinalis]
MVQGSGAKYKGLISCAQTIVREEGPAALLKAARLAGWLPEVRNLYSKASHGRFGLVLGSDGKRFRTRSSEVVRLAELLDEARD